MAYESNLNTQGKIAVWSFTRMYLIYFRDISSVSNDGEMILESQIVIYRATPLQINTSVDELCSKREGMSIFGLSRERRARGLLLKMQLGCRGGSIP